MSIVEYDGPPSWSLYANGAGESTKCPWVQWLFPLCTGTPGQSLNLKSKFINTWKISFTFSLLVNSSNLLEVTSFPIIPNASSNYLKSDEGKISV